MCMLLLRVDVRTDRPQVHRCGRYDLHYVSQEHAHSAMGAKKLCAKKQMAFPESQTDECLSLFIRILDIDVWTDVAGYANRMVICVIRKSSYQVDCCDC